MSDVTINDFVRYRKLRAEAVKLARQIQKLEEHNHQERHDKVTGSSVYFPYTERHISIIGLLHNTARINAKKDELDEVENEIELLASKLYIFLKTVEDREIRETLELYYIDGLKYGQIAEYMGLEGDGSWLMQKARRYMRSKINPT